MKTIRIRYCGGCNPDYDRVRLAEKIQKRLKRRCRFVAGNDGNPDWILVIQGCSTACAEADKKEAGQRIDIRSPQRGTSINI